MVSPRFVLRGWRRAHWAVGALRGIFSALGQSLENVRTRHGQVRNLPAPQHQHQYLAIDTNHPRPKPRPPHAREITSVGCVSGDIQALQGAEVANFVPFLVTACLLMDAFMTSPPPSHSRPMCGRHTRSQAAIRHFRLDIRCGNIGEGGCRRRGKPPSMLDVKATGGRRSRWSFRLDWDCQLSS